LPRGGKLALLACLLGVGVAQQRDRPDAQFEVASIKASAPDSGGTTVYNSLDRFRIDSATVRYLIACVYNVGQFQIVGAPNWADSERYDVVARPQGQLSDTRIRLMVENLPVERMGFQSTKRKRKCPFSLSLLRRAVRN
jgi:uncharacterized protein (TIGR03435 family)